MTRELKFRAWDGSRMGQVAVLSMGGCVSFVGSASEHFIVPKEQIMQYTGLTDRNGVEIYEGDILQGGRRGLVVFEDGAFCIRYSEDSNYIANENLFEVIGNIYENPELLEQ